MVNCSVVGGGGGGVGGQEYCSIFTSSFCILFLNLSFIFFAHAQCHVNNKKNANLSPERMTRRSALRGFLQSLLFYTKKNRSSCRKLFYFFLYFYLCYFCFLIFFGLSQTIQLPVLIPILSSEVVFSRVFLLHVMLL